MPTFASFNGRVDLQQQKLINQSSFVVRLYVFDGGINSTNSFIELTYPGLIAQNIPIDTANQACKNALPNHEGVVRLSFNLLKGTVDALGNALPRCRVDAVRIFNSSGTELLKAPYDVALGYILDADNPTLLVDVPFKNPYMLPVPPGM